MTPQNLVTALLQMDERAGYAVLQKQLSSLNTDAQQQLIESIKREADSRWDDDTHVAYQLAGHLLSIGDLTGSRYAHALGLMTRGDALRRLGRNGEAIKFLDAAGKEFLSVGDDVGWARTRIGRISACLQLNLTAEALRDAGAAREVFVRYNNLKRAGQIDVNAAIVHFELGQYEQALRLYDRAIETYLLLNEEADLLIARARGNKAITLAALGRFREAIALHSQARAIFAAHEDQKISVARQEQNIAEIYAAQGHYSQALLLFNRSREYFNNHGMELPAAEVAQPICNCLLRLNRSREAYALAGELVAYFRHSSIYRSNMAQSLLYQAEAAMLTGDLSDAHEKLREARSILEAMGFMALASKVRLQQAELYFVSGQYADSLREARYVADAFAEQEALPQLARAALLQARILANLGNTASAQELCQQALDIAQGQGLLDLKYSCDFMLGQIAEFHQDTQAATSYYEQAIKGIEDVQSHLVLDERSSFLEDKGAVYQKAMILALKHERKEQALIYVEKAKSRVLGDYLRNNIDIRLRAADKASEAILEDLAHLREEQAWYSSIVYDAEYEANLSDTAVLRVRAMKPGQARQEMQQRERSIEHLLEQIQLRLAGDLASRSRSKWTDSIITSLWQKLERNTLMLEYYLTESDLYIFQMTRAGVDTLVIPGVVPRLERLLSLWRVNLDLAAQASGAQDRSSAFAGLQENSLGLLQRLYDMLLKPVENALEGIERLTIVPYGLLHYLPFHCLFDGVQFVIERINVSYLPAAALHEICRKRGKEVRLKGIHLQNSLVMGLSDNGRLPFARQEAEAVAKLLGAPVALNEAATRSLLMEVGSHSPIVHIAAHGMFRLDAPNFSHIQLADGKLDAIDVFNLDLSSCSLLTLSACETGRAIVKGVDEVIGLGRGFLYAGAASLLPTLWKVDDASSAELMEMFYQALLNDLPKAAALAGAQRAFLARSRTSIRPYRIHPYFWAGFQLIGDAGAL